MEIKNNFKKDEISGRCSECVYRWNMDVCQRCQGIHKRKTMVRDLYRIDLK